MRLKFNPYRGRIKKKKLVRRREAEMHGRFKASVTGALDSD